MLLGRFLQGVGASGPRIMVSALVRDCFSGRKMARVMSFVGTVFMMVPLLAPMLGQAILWIGPWQYIFVMYIGVSVLLAIWVYLRLQETLPAENRRSIRPMALWQAFLIVIRNRLAAGYTVASGILFGAFLGYLSSSQLVFQDIYSVGDAYPLYFAVLVLPNVASSLLNAKLVMRWGMYRVVQTTNILVLVGATSLFFYAQTYAGVPPLANYMAFLFFIFSGVGLQFGNLNTLAMEPLGKVAGMGASIVGTGSTMVSIPIGGLIGMSISQSVTPLALGLAVCALVSMLLMHWVRFGVRLPN
jgi:DHA1 family bicyclomycin/chloramphenicol resistance-like MFS transporter